MEEDFDLIIKKVYSRPERNYEIITGDVTCKGCGLVAIDYEGYDHCPKCGEQLTALTSVAQKEEALTWAVDESGFRHPFISDRPESQTKFVRYDKEDLY